MTEVILVKRLLALVFVALLALSTVACTREKPVEPATTVIVAAGKTPTPGTPSAAGATPVATTPIVVVPATPPILPTFVPAATSAPAPTSFPTSSPGTYTVQWGDWLSKIAGQFNVTTQDILAANPGLNPNLIYPGQVLKIPSGSSSTMPSPVPLPPPPSSGGPYTIQRGDWIYAIARKFNITVAALLAANPGLNPSVLYPGQVIQIPGSGSTTPPEKADGTYTVKPGDTLFSIAVRLRTTAIALQIKNKLANPNFIFPGQVLTIPQ